MSPFCNQKTIDSILYLRKTLMEEEVLLAKLGEQALYHYNREIGGTNPVGGWVTARLNSDGTHLVYDLGGGTIELVPVDFLLDPDIFVTNYRKDRAVSDEEVVNRFQTDRNYVVTNYP